ncbi:RNA recognition motif domain-containing protein [Brumicola nitratireducens]|uniref:RNA-binding region RNP-1 n=1 Tax=Glaciecola nitratireducens (strain JCM 12485 / KCTC 12276 / FR1064) TaxID=1085623 RepID=G4QJT0_GLANF|nr:RNA-binding region RNP-1 [Glaciecola nitratireducens]AEP28972.1 RNA-binding region RNP-1 [Glaciecola nitratireducens FR1064]
MVSVKAPLLLVASIVLAVIGFFVAGPILGEGTSSIAKSMFSAGVLLNAVLIFILSSMTKSSSSVTTAPVSSPTTSASTDVESDEDVSTLYVGNLPYRANEQIVKEHFEKFGYVRSVRLMKDKRTGKRKGFGFVEVAAQEADSMIKELNDSEFEERTIKVRPAKDKVA